jgi:hypothetical protein
MRWCAGDLFETCCSTILSGRKIKQVFQLSALFITNIIATANIQCSETVVLHSHLTSRTRNLETLHRPRYNSRAVGHI